MLAISWVTLARRNPLWDCAWHEDQLNVCRTRREAAISMRPFVVLWVSI